MASYDHGTPSDETQLDTCVLYSGATSIAANATSSWPLVTPKGDRPDVTIGTAAQSPLTDVRLQDYFNTYLMYRPAITSMRKSNLDPIRERCVAVGKSRVSFGQD